MNRGRLLAPLVAAAIGLAGALAATLSLYHAAAGAMDRVLEERLRGAGESAAALLGRGQASSPVLRAVMRANDLDGAYVVSHGLRVIADATGPSGRRADLLRLDIGHLQAAFAGSAGVAPGYAFGTLRVMTGYFPMDHAGRPGGDVGGGGSPTPAATDPAAPDVLVLEAGQTFVAARARIDRARTLGLLLAFVSALGLAIAATRWNRAERQRQQAAARAARGEALSRLAAMAAHEIRNPLGVIRGTVDLMRERAAPTLSDRDRRDLDDIGGEVERLRRLTQDLLDLSAERSLARSPTLLAEVLGDVARATESAFPGITVRCAIPALPAIGADAARLRQLFGNLLANAAQAQREGEIEVSVTCDARTVRAVVRDRGPGIPADVADRLFDLYFTTKSGGTGLGLAIARRFAEAHGGTLAYLGDRSPGAAFEVTLPIIPPSGGPIERG